MGETAQIFEKFIQKKNTQHVSCASNMNYKKKTFDCESTYLACCDSSRLEELLNMFLEDLE